MRGFEVIVTWASGSKHAVARQEADTAQEALDAVIGRLMAFPHNRHGGIVSMEVRDVDSRYGAQGGCVLEAIEALRSSIAADRASREGQPRAPVHLHEVGSALVEMADLLAELWRREQ